MKKLSLVLLVGFLVFSFAKAFAQDGEGDDAALIMPEFRRFFDRLNLSDDQKKQVETMRSAMQKQLISNRAKIATAFVELGDLKSADTPDKAAIENKINEISQYMLTGVKTRLNTWFEVNKIFTPEQQKVWKEVLKHPLAAHHAMMQRRGLGRRFRGWQPLIEGAPMDRMKEAPQEKGK